MGSTIEVERNGILNDGLSASLTEVHGGRTLSVVHSEPLANIAVSYTHLQLNAENFAMAFGDVYTFGPTFRAENSNTCLLYTSRCV